MNPAIPSQKNIVYGNISAGGDVHIGDVIYQVSEDFSHSILFLRIEHIADDNYTAQLTLKSRHLGKKGLAATGLPLLIQPIKLNISAQLFQQVSDFQSIRRLGDINFRKTERATPESLRLEEEQLISLLFDTFFTGDILTVCRDFVELLEKRKIEELLLAISVDDTQIINLPFEMVIPRFFPEKLGQARQSLAVSHFGLVRTFEKALSQFDMQGKAASAAPLKMLFVTALPENMGEENKLLEIEEEQKRLIDAIGILEATDNSKPKIVIEFLDTASLAEISEALRKHKHDILHISGHGSYNPKVNQGVLHLEDENGNHCQVLGKELGESLRQHQCVKLLILSACETAIAGNGVVEQLATFGLPSIIAMRFSVTDVGAKVFTTALYEALSKAETLTQAIAQAREQLWVYVEQARKQEPNRPHLAEWFTPVVYLNQYTEALVNLKEKYALPEDFYPHSVISPTDDREQKLIGQGFIGRKRYLIQMRKSFAKKHHVCIHGLGGIGKTTLAEAFANNYENHKYKVIDFRNKAEINEYKILEKLLGRFKRTKPDPDILADIEDAIADKNITPIQKLQKLINAYLRNRYTILLFDNFEDVQKSEDGEYQQAIGSAALAEFMTYLCQNTPQNCHLLFTTRYKIVDLAEDLTHLALDKMTYAEQYRLTNFSETLRKIPMSERQDMVKRLDGHPRAYEFLETLLKKDKTLTWTNLSKQIGTVEAKVWEDLLLAKIYEKLNPEEQQLLQVCAVFISRTPIAALEYVIEKTALKTVQLEVGGLLGLCLYDEESQVFEVHRLTREWMVKNVIADIKLKEWALLAGGYFRTNFSVSYLELAKSYFEISESWEDFANTSNVLQRFYYQVGFYKRAFILNCDVLEKNISKKLKATALNLNGVINISLGENDNALISLNKSLEIAKFASDTDLISANLINIGHIYENCGNYENALTFYKNALDISQKENYGRREMTVLNNMGLIFKNRGEYDLALNYLETSLEMMYKLKISINEEIVLNNIGQVYFHKGDFKNALNNYEKSLKVIKNLGESRIEPLVLSNIGQIYDYQKNYDKALVYYEKSLEIIERNGDIQNLGTILNNIGKAHYSKGNKDLAIKYYEKSLFLNQKTGNKKMEGIVLNNIALSFIFKEDPENAISNLKKSILIKDQMGDIEGVAQSLNDFGIIAFKFSDNIENMISYFLKSRMMFMQIGSPSYRLPESYLNEIIKEIGEEKFQEIVTKLNQQ